MTTAFSWRKMMPLLAVGVLTAGVVSVAAHAQLASANDAKSSNQARGWDNSNNSKSRYYLMLDGITGGVTDEKHKGAIQLDSYRILEDEPDTPEAQSTTPLAAFGDNNLRFLADASKASPALFEKASTGAVIPSATLMVHNATNKKDYFTLKMTNVIIASYQNSGNPEFGNMDEVVLDYETLTVEHNEGTAVKEGWDFRKKQELQ